MAMTMKILFAVDGSGYTKKAAEFLSTHFNWFKTVPELHVLHVKLPIPRGLALVQAEQIVGSSGIESYYRDEAESALKPAEEILRNHNIPFQWTYRVGDIAKEICTYASENHVDMIVMGSHGHRALENVLLGSVATRVLAMTPGIPVLIVR